MATKDAASARRRRIVIAALGEAVRRADAARQTDARTPTNRAPLGSQNAVARAAAAGAFCEAEDAWTASVAASNAARPAVWRPKKKREKPAPPPGSGTPLCLGLCRPPSTCGDWSEVIEDDFEDDMSGS